jgi:hypothetical protein
VLGFRRTSSAVLVVVVSLLAMVGLAGAAAGASGNIAIVSAGPDGGGDPYDLTIVANDANAAALTSMTAHVYDAGLNDVADVTMVAQSVTDPTNQTWVAQTPIPQAALPPGTYTVTVDASDGTESDSAIPAPSPFSFSYATTVSVAPSPPSVTQGSQTVVFTGSVTGVAPGGTQTGIANVPVSLSISGGSASQVAVTDSNGAFSYQLAGISQAADYNFSVDPTSTYSAGNDDVLVGVAQAATTLLVTPSPVSVTEGAQTVNFAGSVTVQPQGSTTSSGLAGVPVDLSISGGTASQVAVTDSNGNFSYPVSGISETADYNFSVAPTTLYSAASDDVTVAVTQAQSTITVTPSPAFVTYGSQSVTFSGTVTAAGSGGTVPVGGAPVILSVSGGAPTQVATTGSNGKFSYPVSGISQTTSYVFSVGSTSLYTGANVSVAIPLDPGFTNLAVTPNPPDVNLGSSTVVFTGTATVTPAGSTATLGAGSGVPIYLTVGGGPTVQVATTSDAAGDFSYTATGITQAADYNFSVDPSSFYSAASDAVPIGLNQLNTNLTVKPSQMNVTEGSQSVTFSGTATGTAPGSSTSISIGANVPVYLSVGGGAASQVAVTNSGGAFSYSASGISAATDYNFSVNASSTYTAATSDVPIGLDPAQTRITGISLSPTHLKYSQKTTLTGTLQYLSGSSWTGLAGSTVHLVEGSTSVGSVSTSASGSFTATLPSTHGSAWRASVNSATLTQAASAIGTMSISVPMKVRSFSAKLGVLDGVTASGCLQVTAPVGYGPESKIEIQYASKPGGPWKELGAIQLHNVSGAPSWCRDSTESFFSEVIRAKQPDAYYRAYFAANYSFQGAVSPAIHAWRFATRITSFQVTPRAIATGKTVKISGRLWRLGKSWKPYGQRTVDFIYNEKGTSYWSSLSHVKTTAGGYFSETAIGSNGSFVAVIYAVYGGSATDLAVQSPGLAVSVNKSNTAGLAGPAASVSSARLPVISAIYLGLGMLATDAIDVVGLQLKALAAGP